MNRKAKEIIDGNKYMVVSTSDKDGGPWGATVLYVYDEESELFFFFSDLESLHSRNIIENPRVSLTIFNAGSPIGEYKGIQVEGNAHLVGKDKLDLAFNLYSKRIFPNANAKQLERLRLKDYYMESSKSKFFYVEATHTYLANGAGRVEVDVIDLAGIR